MTLHESFWVVTGAAAPVIALTNLVAINDALSIRQALLMAPYDAWPDDVKAFTYPLLATQPACRIPVTERYLGGQRGSD